MFRSIVVLFVNLITIAKISGDGLSGVYVIDSCKCSSPTETCETNGPFIFDQQRSTLAIRYGTTQVGVGALDKNQMDLYFNHNRCKGSWDIKTRSAELTCQRPGDVVCSTKLRCVSGVCRDAKSFDISSSAKTVTISVVSILIGLLLSMN